MADWASVSPRPSPEASEAPHLSGPKPSSQPGRKGFPPWVLSKELARCNVILPRDYMISEGAPGKGPK